MSAGPTPEQLDRFLSGVEVAQLVDRIAERSGTGASTVRERLEIYLNESRVALDAVADAIVPGARILEVGSGTCIFALFLRSLGYDVTALEPAGIGFDYMSVTRDVVMESWPTVDLPLLRCGVDDLDPEVHGRFDLVFSVNVFEHLPDPEGALDRIMRVTEPGGRTVHLCPNYTVPFEPHFGVPLLPFAPKRVAAKAMPRRIRESDLWRSLSFVTVRRVTAYARSRGLSVAFRRGLMAEAFERARVDPVFAERHPGIARVSGAVLAVLGRPMRALPPSLASPMVFTLSRRPARAGR